MLSRRGVNSVSTKASDPVIVLFICVGVVLITLPLIVSCAVLVRKCLRRNHSDGQPQIYKLRQLRLRSEPPGNSTIPSDPMVSAAIDQVSSTNPPSAPSRSKSKTPTISSRLSKPIHLPIRLSTLQPRKPKPETTSKPHNSPPKSTSETSLVSSMTEPKETKHAFPSPVSSLSSIELDVDKPRPTYQLPRHTSRNQSRQSEIIYDQDLFLESLAQCGGDTREKGKTPYSEATRAEFGIGNSSGRERAKRQYESGREEEDWRQARMETVDGVLAPREWV